MKIRIEHDGCEAKVYINDAIVICPGGRDRAMACGIDPRITITKDKPRAGGGTLEFEFTPLEQK